MLQNSILLLPVLRRVINYYCDVKERCVCVAEEYFVITYAERDFSIILLLQKSVQFSAVLEKSFFSLLAVLLMSFRLSQLLEKSVQL